VAAAEVADTTGLASGRTSIVRAPGTMPAHYAPHARVRLVDAADLVAGPDSDATTGLLALAEVSTPVGLVRLMAPTSADAYAQGLYAALREADALGLSTVLAVAPAPGGVGAAVIDRLQRAAAGR
jgi:L-threonylcarbamoyladenylate synthase